jgi:hypothetical protein
MKLTESQRRTFFAALRPAAEEVGEKVEDYRRRILREELGVESLLEVSRGSGFDKLMARVCIDRGDFERAVKYSSQTLSRMRHLIVEAATKIIRANGFSGTPYAYIAGVMAQAKMSQHSVAVLSECLPRESAWMQFTEGQLKRLLMMLQTHLRRI